MDRPRVGRFGKVKLVGAVPAIERRSVIWRILLVVRINPRFSFGGSTLSFGRVPFPLGQRTVPLGTLAFAFGHGAFTLGQHT
jgi:hypothetical protein